jgi:hypothetical protein
MTIQEFEAKREEFKIQGTGVLATVKKDKVWKSKTTGQITVVIPAGAKVHVYFSPDKYRETIFTKYGDIVKISNTVHAHEWLTKFKKKPSIKTLQKRMFGSPSVSDYSKWDCASRSVINEKVEPDGHGPSGAPSWELVLGLI